MNLKKTSTLLFLWPMILFTSCSESVSNTRETIQSSESRDTLYIHNKEASGRTNWSYSINNKPCNPLPRNKEILLKIDLVGEFAQLKKRTSLHITPIDSNCRVTKINDQKFKVYISDRFSPDILKLTIEASPNKNITVINTQHQMTYNFQDKFFLSQINNIVAKE